MKARAGSTLVELIAAAALFGIIAAACAALVRSQTLLLRNTSERAATNEALRTGRSVLRAELQDILSDDRHAIAADSLALRAFRGSGIVCAITIPRVTMRYRGLRQPDPTKDSILVAGADRAGAIRMVSSRIDPCVTLAGEQPVAIEPDFPISAGDIVLFFESGSYHLAASALRYRRGASGLQPITDDFIDHRNSSFALDSTGTTLKLNLRATASSPASTRQFDTRIGLRNP